jgi:hypothetical protein
MENNTDKIISITRDKGANLKKLRRLENDGKIQINEIQFEEMPKKYKKAILPVAVFDQTSWDQCVLAGDDCKYEEIREIIGKSNVRDAINLEAHLRNGFDYFVTEDKNEFIKNGRREMLESKFLGLKIVTVVELEHII